MAGRQRHLRGGRDAQMEPRGHLCTIVALWPRRMESLSVGQAAFRVTSGGSLAAGREPAVGGAIRLRVRSVLPVRSGRPVCYLRI